MGLQGIAADYSGYSKYEEYDSLCFVSFLFLCEGLDIRVFRYSVYKFISSYNMNNYAGS